MAFTKEELQRLVNHFCDAKLEIVKDLDSDGSYNAEKNVIHLKEEVLKREGRALEVIVHESAHCLWNREVLKGLRILLQRGVNKMVDEIYKDIGKGLDDSNKDWIESRLRFFKENPKELKKIINGQKEK